MLKMKKKLPGASLMDQWVRLCALNAGGLGSISGQGTRSRILQLRVYMLKLKILHAAAKTWHSQKKKKEDYFF